jgi:hypothetical protein
MATTVYILYKLCSIYLGTTITNQNLIQEDIKKRLNSRNVCYHSAQNLFSSRLLSKNIKIRIYKTIILPMVLVLYGCETWSLKLRGKQRQSVFANRMLRRIFGPKRKEVTGGFRKLHNEERNAYRILVGEPKGNRPLGRPRRRWVANIKKDLTEIEWDGID